MSRNALVLVLIVSTGFTGREPIATAQQPLLMHQPLITPEAAEAAQRGLAFLASEQLPTGSFAARGNGRNPAVCGLAGMAFLASGSTPGRGPSGPLIDRTIDYLLACSDRQSGLIADPETSARGPMYAHGFATLFLAETYGMAKHPELRDRLAEAIALIVQAQNSEGGWRDMPQSRDADISVTVCQVMALRAARNAGFAVPKSTIDRSVAYVRRCQNLDGGFRYMASGGGPLSGFARSAAGVVALFNAGIYEGPEADAGIAYLASFRPGPDGRDVGGYYFYGHYYAVQTMWHVGGEAWQAWYPAIRDELVARQLGDGSWRDPAGEHYATAMACIVLLTPNNYLPILQR